MVITEKEKHMVVFSSLFDRHYANLFDEISDILWSYHMGYGTLSHTKDYWVRDFMPIQRGGNIFLKFIYNPDYLQDQKKYITDVDKVIKRCPFAKYYTIVEVPLVVDGGNMVFCKGKGCYGEADYVVMTEKVLAENPGYSKQQIELIIKSAFQDPLLTIVWLPWEKEDVFGHTDGIVRYVGINKEGRPKVLVNLELYSDDIADRMYEILVQYFEVVELQLSKYDELSWAYINSLQTQYFIIIPGIGDPVTDGEAFEQYNALFPEYKDKIYMVQMRDFIKEHGGALNCLTWTIKPTYS